MKRALRGGLTAASLLVSSLLRGQAPPPAPVPAPADPVLVGAGDIAYCDEIAGAKGTAALLDHIEGTVFTLGDNAYNKGTPEEFEKCYAPTWGRHKARTHPAPGNHEYGTKNAAGYFAYFGAAAGEPGKGYYSYDLGKWHVVVINSNCKKVGGCEKGSPQETWLREDLAAHPALCTVAMWHHPRFSSAEHGDDRTMSDIWRTLIAAGADVVLSGHDHDYERFGPQDADGKPDPAHGIREFVVGTGGRELYKWEHIDTNSEVRNDVTFGVLKLTLHPDSYDWQFIPAEGYTFTDAGTGTCH